MGGGKICTELMAKRIGTCVLISVLLLVCIYIVAFSTSVKKRTPYSSFCWRVAFCWEITAQRALHRHFKDLLMGTLSQ